MIKRATITAVDNGFICELVEEVKQNVTTSNGQVVQPQATAKVYTTKEALLKDITKKLDD